MQQGRGGMGSHKHGISGHSGPSPRFKFMRTFEANREREAETRAIRRRKPKMFPTVAEAFRRRSTP